MNDQLVQILIRAKDEASATLAGVGKSVDSLGQKTTSFVTRNTQGASILSAGLLVTLGLVTKAAVGQAEAFQQNRIAFDTMLGSADKARVLLAEVSKFAEKTPFALPEVVEGAKRLLAYGIAGEQIIPTFSMLGNIAAGVGRDKLPQLILAFGQVRAATYLTGAELRQFTEAGVPLLGQLAKQSGKTAAQIKEDMESGARIPFEQVEKALQSMTGKGGMFFQLMEKQSKSFGGVMSNVGDQVGRIIRNMVGINDQGDVREGSFFATATQGAIKLLEALQVLTPKLQTLVEYVEQNRVVMWALIGAIGGLVALAGVALVAAFGGAIVMMGVFAAVGAGIAALAYTIITNWDQIKAFFQDLWSKVVGYATEAWNKIVLGATFVKDHFFEIIGFIVGFFATLPLKLPYYTAVAITKVVSLLAEVNWGAVFSGLFNAWLGGWKMMGDAALRVFNFVNNLNWGSIVSGIGRGMGNAVIGLIEGAINGAFAGIPGSPRVNVPRFAQGVRNFGGGLAVVGEKGPELVNLPAGSDVFSNQDSRQMGGLIQNNVFHIHNDTDAELIVRELGWRLSA